MPAPAAIVCEVTAPRAIEAGALAEIAATCARELGQPLVIKTVVTAQPRGERLLTLHLPVEYAASQHAVWCLACRLACFCPSARVSVFVSADRAFAPPPAPAARRRKSA